MSEYRVILKVSQNLVVWVEAESAQDALNQEEDWGILCANQGMTLADVVVGNVLEPIGVEDEDDNVLIDLEKQPYE